MERERGKKKKWAKDQTYPEIAFPKPQSFVPKQNKESRLSKKNKKTKDQTCQKFAFL